MTMFAFIFLMSDCVCALFTFIWDNVIYSFHCARQTRLEEETKSSKVVHEKKEYGEVER